MTVTAGVGSFVAIGEESTWGTPATRTRFFPLLSSGDNLGAEVSRMDSEDMIDIAFDNALVYEGRHMVRGSIEIEAQYEGQLFLLKHAFHHTPTPTGGGPYTWTFTPQHTSTVLGLGLSIEVLRGGAQANSMLYQGCKITKFTFTTQENGISKINMEFIGERVTSITKTAIGTMGVSRIRTPTQQSSQYCVINSVNRICRGVTFSYDRKFETRFEGTSRYTLEPFPSAKPEATISLELEFEDHNEFSDFLAVSQRAIDVIIEGSPTTAKLTIAATLAILQDGGVPFTNSFGIITWNPTWKLYANPGVIREFTWTLLTNEATIS